MVGLAWGVDAIFDDGILTTGAFRQTSGNKYIYVLEW